MASELKWSLLRHGDGVEQASWPKLKDKFPNYEVFWSLYIVPMTCRELPLDHPLWIRFKKDVNPSLQHVAMSHYTIFKSLLFIDEIIHRHITEDIKNALPATYSERVDNVYIYLGTVIDMVENLFFNIAKIKALLAGSQICQELSSIEIINMANDYVKQRSQYEKSFKQFIEKKRPVSMKLHDAGDVLLLRDEPLRKAFKHFCNNIRHYRNAIIHNPQMGTLYDKQGVAWTPKKDMVDKYMLWGNLYYAFDGTDFVRSEQVIKEDFDSMCTYLNKVWDYLIEMYEEISQHTSYSKLLGYIPTVEQFYIPPPGADTDYPKESSSAQNTTASGSGDRMI